MAEGDGARSTVSRRRHGAVTEGNGAQSASCRHWGDTVNKGSGSRSAGSRRRNGPIKCIKQAAEEPVGSLLKQVWLYRCVDQVYRMTR